MIKKIIIVAQPFPPLNGGGVQRISKFSNILSLEGYQVVVYTGKNINASWIENDNHDIDKKIKVIRIDENIKISQKFLLKLFGLDSLQNWSNEILKSIKNQENVDLVITSGPPHSVHKIGLGLSKNIRWIADFRDHFSLRPNQNFLFDYKNFLFQKTEQKIYNKANFIICNTNQNRLDVLSKFKSINSFKFRVIYNGFDKNELVKNIIKGKRLFNNKYLNLVYVGGMRGDKIDSYFYKVIQKALLLKPELKKTLRIHLYGDLSRMTNSYLNFNLKEVIIKHGALPYSEIGNVIYHSDGCLTWQNPDPAYIGTIAGKVFDYIGIGKPIYSLGQQKGELNTLINTNKIGVHSNVSDNKNSALDFIYFVENLSIFTKNYEKLGTSFQSQFERNIQVKELIKLIKSL